MITGFPDSLRRCYRSRLTSALAVLSACVTAGLLPAQAAVQGDNLTGNCKISVSSRTASPSPVWTGATVTFTASATGTCPNNPLTYSWTFGDGASGMGATATHTYSKVGAYTASVTVSDGTTSASQSVSLNVFPTTKQPSPGTPRATTSPIFPATADRPARLSTRTPGTSSFRRRIRSPHAAGRSPA